MYQLEQAFHDKAASRPGAGKGKCQLRMSGSSWHIQAACRNPKDEHSEAGGEEKHLASMNLAACPCGPQAAQSQGGRMGVTAVWSIILYSKIPCNSAEDCSLLVLMGLMSSASL